MATNKLQKNFLVYMLKKHEAAHGDKKSNLADSHLYITSGQGMEQEIPGIRVLLESGMWKYLVAETAIELEHQGLVEFNTNNTKFWLTRLGYDQASKGQFRRLLDFLNANGGISILVSGAALVISLVAAYFSYVNALKPDQQAVSQTVPPLQKTVSSAVTVGKK
jgi:hypothetical protein